MLSVPGIPVFPTSIVQVTVQADAAARQGRKGQVSGCTITVRLQLCKSPRTLISSSSTWVTTTDAKTTNNTL
jgi:hypothetical protein